MLLSTLQRCLQASDLYTTSFEEVTAQVRRDFARELANVSQIVERTSNAPIQVGTFTELLTGSGNPRLYPRYAPVHAILELQYDPMCLFGDAGYTVLTQGVDYVLDDSQRRVNLLMNFPAIYNTPGKPYRMRYVGGHAHNTEKTIYNAVVTGTITPGKYDQTNGYIVDVKAYDSILKTITFVPDIGVFDTGDTIECGTGNTALLGTVVEKSIINNYASLEDAVIKQVAYGYERRKSVGKHSTTSGNAQTTYMGEYQVLQILKDACDMFQYYSVGC